MERIVFFLKITSILIAAILLGNWFLAEFKHANATGKPWYAVYLSAPGLLILLATLIVPIALWLMSH